MDFLDAVVFAANGVDYTVSKVALLVFSLVALFFVSGWVKKVVSEKALNNRMVSSSSRHTVGILSRYIILTIGLIVILNQAGIDLDTLTVVLGALGVGIGFGLQNIVNNFVSGLIILFERPIQVGDRVEVAEVEGNIVEVSLRSTTVRTNDNVNIIVPNSEFISKSVVNWSHTDSKVRRRASVGVSYSSDPEKVKNALLEVAKENKNVLDFPEPDVLFREFGDSSLNFELRVWTESMASKPGKLVSELNFAIFEKFKEMGIHIPFPQRDVYIKEQP